MFIRQDWSQNLQLFGAKIYRMIPESPEQKIFDQANKQIHSAINSCTKKILTALEKSFTSLNDLHRQKESEKDNIIKEQKETIDKLKKINDFMDGFAHHYMNFKNSSSEPHQAHLQSQLFSEIPPKNTVDQKLKEKEPTITLKAQMKEQEQVYIFNDKKSVQKSKVQKIKGRPKSQKKAKEKQKSHARRKNSKEKGKNNERRRQYLRRKADDLKRQKPMPKPSSKQKDKNVQKVEFKSPLQCRSSHPLSEVAYTPNFTRLKFVQYEHKRQTVFSEYEVEIMSKHELKDVTAFAFSSREVTNDVLSLFTKLELVNLRSLRIQNNKITDLRPLRNLNLRILQDLDVSNNPLSIQSAYLLAMQNFDELVYFTISFNTGLDSEYWKILLENQMQNYPKLQALDVCNQNQLSPSTKKSIENCMLRKTAYQKRQSGQSGYPDYPEGYQIKISWLESQQIFATYPEEKQLQIGARWQRSVNYERRPLKRLPARKLRKQFQATNSPSKNSKRKGIRKTRGRRGSLQSRVRKMDEHRARKMDERNSESQDVDQSVDQSVGSGENSGSEQERSSE